jgi:serine/threonine protein kinase
LTRVPLPPLRTACCTSGRALGCILNEVCVTDVPFAANNLPDLIKKITSSPPTPIPDSYGPEVSRIITWMLTKDADQRPLMRDVMQDAFIISSIRECKQRLGDILKGGQKSEVALSKLRDDLAKLQRKRQKWKASLSQIVKHDPEATPLTSEQMEKLKAAERQLRNKLADLKVQIFILDKELADTETNDTKQIVSHLDATLNLGGAPE